ncbi:MAG: helix-turn-helix domain-containing protein [Algicola sp.]|nr:helix-turn-helix domain-containing protein [Algicola sp.]
MDVITMESEAYQRIMERLDQVHQELVRLQNPTKELSREWIDGYDVCHILNISRRTLTKYLSEGKLRYSKVDGKNYFKLKDVEAFLLEKYGRHMEERKMTKNGTK